MTGLLTVAYAGLVLLATQVFRFHTPVVVAASTLTAAVLFNLPRRRLQRAVNRRFHRLACHGQTAAFAARPKKAWSLSVTQLRHQWMPLPTMMAAPEHRACCDRSPDSAACYPRTARAYSAAFSIRAGSSGGVSRSATLSRDIHAHSVTSSRCGVAWPLPGVRT